METDRCKLAALPGVNRHAIAHGAQREMSEGRQVDHSETEAEGFEYIVNQVQDIAALNGKAVVDNEADFIGGPARIRTWNQTVMSRQL